MCWAVWSKGLDVLGCVEQRAIVRSKGLVRFEENTGL